MQTPRKIVRVARLRDVARHLRVLADAVDRAEHLWEDFTPESKQKLARDLAKMAVVLGNESGRLKKFREKVIQRKV
jgi:hypothetical protein